MPRSPDRPTKARPTPPAPADADGELRLLSALVDEVRRDPARFRSPADLAAAAGTGEARLHGLFVAHHHLSPADLLLRERVAAARRILLAQGDATDGEVAAAVGFGGAGEMGEALLRRTGLDVAGTRRLGSSPEFVLALPPGYLRAYTLRLMGRDPLSVTERVAGDAAAKGVLLGGGTPAVLALEFAEGAVRVRVEAARALSAGDVREAHAIAVRLLGLTWDPAPFEARAAGDEAVARMVAGREGLRVPQTATVFEGLVWAVVGQQVNLPFAFALRRALAEACGQAAGAGLLAHPSPAQVAALDHADLARLRFSRRKAEYVIDAARAIVSGALALETLPDGSATEAERTLLAIRGFGRWSAHYVMMRACGFGDCVPVGDAGLTLALQRFFSLPERPGPAETLARMSPFAPHRTLATHHLWATLAATA